MNIADHVDMHSLESWRATSSLANATACDQINHRVNTIFAAFVDDTNGFHNLLCITRSVVSRSTALQILDVECASQWTPHDTDIYTPIDTTFHIEDYLVNVKKYAKYNPPQTSPLGTTSPPNGPHSDIEKGYHCVICLQRGKTCINIIQSTTPSALHPIPFFWASHITNFVSANGFILTHPNYTLKGHGILNPRLYKISALSQSGCRICNNVQKYKN